MHPNSAHSQLVSQKRIPFVFDGTASTLTLFKDSHDPVMSDAYKIAIENHFVLPKPLDPADIYRALDDGKAVIAGTQEHTLNTLRKSLNI